MRGMEAGSRGRGHMYTHSEFTSFTAETNTALWSNYVPIKKKNNGLEAYILKATY